MVSLKLPVSKWNVIPIQASCTMFLIFWMLWIPFFFFNVYFQFACASKKEYTWKEVPGVEGEEAGGVIPHMQSVGSGGWGRSAPFCLVTPSVQFWQPVAIFAAQGAAMGMSVLRHWMHNAATFDADSEHRVARVSCLFSFEWHFFRDVCWVCLAETVVSIGVGFTSPHWSCHTETLHNAKVGMCYNAFR